MDNIGRRTFVRGATAGALAFTVGGVDVLLLPSEARAQKVPLKVLSADEALRLEAVSDDAGARRARRRYLPFRRSAMLGAAARGAAEHPHQRTRGRHS